MLRHGTHVILNLLNCCTSLAHLLFGWKLLGKPLPLILGPGSWHLDRCPNQLNWFLSVLKSNGFEPILSFILSLLVIANNWHQWHFSSKSVQFAPTMEKQHVAHSDSWVPRIPWLLSLWDPCHMLPEYNYNMFGLASATWSSCFDEGFQHRAQHLFP